MLRLSLLGFLAVGFACSSRAVDESPGPGEARAVARDVAPPPPSRWAGEDLSPFFTGVEGTFVLLDAATGETLVHDPERAATPFLPASTFKIPHTLIALEAGLTEGPDFVVEWDPEATPPQPWWPDAWAGDQTLSAAFSGSVVWFYQELARRIGLERMEMALARFRYGNGELGAGVDRFWLEGDFGVSAMEQVHFLHRFLRGDLGLAEETFARAQELFVIEEGPGHRLSGKTGWAGLGDPSAPQLGWFTGYLETQEGLFLFALNLHMRSPEDAGLRARIVREILQSLQLF